MAKKATMCWQYSVLKVHFMPEIYCRFKTKNFINQIFKLFNSGQFEWTSNRWYKMLSGLWRCKNFQNRESMSKAVINISVSWLSKPFWSSWKTSFLERLCCNASKLKLFILVLNKPTILNCEDSTQETTVSQHNPSTMISKNWFVKDNAEEHTFSPPISTIKNTMNINLPGAICIHKPSS